MKTKIKRIIHPHQLIIITYPTMLTTAIIGRMHVVCVSFLIGCVCEHETITDIMEGSMGKQGVLIKVEKKLYRSANERFLGDLSTPISDVILYLSEKEFISLPV